MSSITNIITQTDALKGSERSGEEKRRRRGGDGGRADKIKQNNDRETEVIEGDEEKETGAREEKRGRVSHREFDGTHFHISHYSLG